jgi:hypothetical protein
MNTENQSRIELQPQDCSSPQSENSAPPVTEPTMDLPDGSSPARQTSSSTWRNNGKVAHLPKAIRDKINIMLQDGLTYPLIIQSLGEDGKDLNTMNLSRWKDSGYQDWLLQQTWLSQTRARQEPASALSTVL